MKITDIRPLDFEDKDAVDRAFEDFRSKHSDAKVDRALEGASYATSLHAAHARRYCTRTYNGIKFANTDWHEKPASP